jgi:hypothetical protein
MKVLLVQQHHDISKTLVELPNTQIIKIIFHKKRIFLTILNGVKMYWKFIIHSSKLSYNKSTIEKESALL